jgi:XTP/dITP diphosphohydrolase
MKLNGEEGILKGAKRAVYFATSNKGKYAEAAILAADFGITLKHLNVEKLEIQSDKLADVASFAASNLASTLHRSVVSEDAGFFVEALNGFPGLYSAYVFRQIGMDGVLKLMQGVSKRSAHFEATVAYCAPGKRAKCFTGIVNGTVSQRPKGKHGFGFDPIFIPCVNNRRTFAEMTTEEKNSFSHRAQAFTKFCKWFNSTQ